MHSPKISIIIPVFNTENYLHRCVDSILSQTYQDFEILLIDDGSTDRSGEICDQYAKLDNRIRVYHKENGGVSSARNWGLKNASGYWITFIDADDWIDKETLKQCLEAPSNVELIRFGMKSVFKNNTYVADARLSESWDYEEFFSKVFSRQTMLGVCGGLYLRSIFVANKIFFNSNYTLGEDWLVLVQYLKCINRIRIINYPFYNYNKQNYASATSTPNLTKFIELNEVASIICYDNDLINRFNHKQVSMLKANICVQCLSYLLKIKSKIRMYLVFLQDAEHRNIYPSLIEILSCELILKFKLVLLLFLPFYHFLKFCKR